MFGMLFAIIHMFRILQSKTLNFYSFFFCCDLFAKFSLTSFFLAIGDEMFSDSFKMKLVDDVVYEVYGKLVQRKQGDIAIEGFNPSAEDADEGTDEAVESGIDVVLNSRLAETYAFGDKKSYSLYLKDYMKK